ncbi:MAG: biotin--[acetyl-CoA-carboxylase] ligase [Betaproteobacteria bacterium]|nr:biotin--[acetyl-CoA-carboxylase] ligase [Betaproteobacteria bacterium]
MKPLAYTVLRWLADGEFHSGEALARAVDASRASVWNAVQEIEANGVEVYRIRGRGYRLAQPLSLLDAGALQRWLGESAPFSVEILNEAESTNTLLLERAREGAPHASVIAAEWQRAGRGRLNRPWHAGLAGALTFSVLWRFSQGAATLAGLSLAVGLALVRALEAFGVSGAGLKWPNDVVWRQRKLAGILIEMQGEALGPSAVVIGVGVNVRLSNALQTRIDQAAADVETLTGQPVDRNRLLAALLTEINRVLLEFERAGFAPLREDWQRRHVHQDCAVRVSLPGGSAESGLARGVGSDGALLLETAQGVKPIHSGDVSLRAVGRAA